MTYQQKLDRIKNALLTVTKDVFHFEAKTKAQEYLVWQEEGSGDSLIADDAVQEQVLRGTVDLFTKNPKKPCVDDVQAALTEADVCWQLLSVQYEEDTQTIHHEWEWEYG